MSDEVPVKSSSPTDYHGRWYWEGNVQAAACAYLDQRGWTVHSQADTAKKAPGKDIEAKIDNATLWVTVKGYPAGTERTNPRSQSRLWFSDAMFDVIRYRGDSEEIEIAVALPDFDSYRKLAEQIAWFQSGSRFWYLWVSESGVHCQHEPGETHPE